MLFSYEDEQVLHWLTDRFLLHSYFEDVTDKAGVNMDHNWIQRTKYNAGTHTFGSSFTVSALINRVLSSLEKAFPRLIT